MVDIKPPPLGFQKTTTSLPTPTSTTAASKASVTESVLSSIDELLSREFQDLTSTTASNKQRQTNSSSISNDESNNNNETTVVNKQLLRHNNDKNNNNNINVDDGGGSRAEYFSSPNQAKPNSTSISPLAPQSQYPSTSQSQLTSQQYQYLAQDQSKQQQPREQRRDPYSAAFISQPTVDANNHYQQLQANQLFDDFGNQQLQLQLLQANQPDDNYEDQHSYHHLTTSESGAPIPQVVDDYSPFDKINYCRSLMQAPKFLTHIIDYAERREGESIHFEACLAPIGDPDLKVEWFFNGRPHVTGSRFHTLHDFGFVVLHIDWLFSRDTGEYICKAKNKFGSATTRAYLKVSPDRAIISDSQLDDPTSIEKLIEMEALWTQVPEPDDEPAPMKRAAPTFILEPRNCAAFEGSCARYSCRITGNPRPRVTWYINGEPVASGSRHKLTFDGMHHLIIAKCQLRDEGLIEVVAVNPLGECRATATLTIKRKLDDYRGVLKNSPNPWYDNSLALTRKVQREAEDQENDDEEYFASMKQKYSHILNKSYGEQNDDDDDDDNNDSNDVVNYQSGDNQANVAKTNHQHHHHHHHHHRLQLPSQQQLQQQQQQQLQAIPQIVGYMDAATPDVNLLASNSSFPFNQNSTKQVASSNANDASKENLLHHQKRGKQEEESKQSENVNLLFSGAKVGDLHPASSTQKSLLSPAPSTIKRALKQKDSIKLPEASFHLDEATRKRLFDYKQQQYDLNNIKDDILERQRLYQLEEGEIKAMQRKTQDKQMQQYWLERQEQLQKAKLALIEEDAMNKQRLNDRSLKIKPKTTTTKDFDNNDNYARYDLHTQTADDLLAEQSLQEYMEAQAFEEELFRQAQLEEFERYQQQQQQQMYTNDQEQQQQQHYRMDKHSGNQHVKFDLNKNQYQPADALSDNESANYNQPTNTPSTFQHQQLKPQSQKHKTHQQQQQQQIHSTIQKAKLNNEHTNEQQWKPFYAQTNANAKHKTPSHSTKQQQQDEKERQVLNESMQMQLLRDEEELLQMYQQAQLEEAALVQRELKMNQQLLDVPHSKSKINTVNTIIDNQQQQQQQQAMDFHELLVSPECKVRGKEVHSHTHKQTQFVHQGDTDITREIIERETVEQQHKGVCRESILRGRSASVERGVSPSPSRYERQGSASRQIVVPAVQQQQAVIAFEEDENLFGPEFVRKIEPCLVYDGDEASFECEFCGDPVPTISWFKESKLLKNSNMYKIETDTQALTSRLTIKRATSDNNAVYTVKAENEVGSAKSSANLIVESHPMAGLKSQSNYRQQQRGQALSPSKSSLPINEQQQQQLQLQKSTNTKLVALRNSRAETPEDQRILKSTKTRTLSAAEMANVVRASPVADDLVAPTFLHTILSNVSQLGELVRFDARIIGSKPIQVCWLHNGERINVDKNHKMVLEGDTHTLLILECAQCDAGVYACSASNEVGEATCEASLQIISDNNNSKQLTESGNLSKKLASSSSTIKAAATATSQSSNENSNNSTSKTKKPQYYHRFNPLLTQSLQVNQQQTQTPKLIKRLENQQVEIGKALTLRCIISSHPSVQVSWFHADKQIKPSKYFKIFKDNDETYCLRLVEVYAEDDGEYKCVARSDDGLATIETSAFVTVLSKEQANAYRLEQQQQHHQQQHYQQQKSGSSNKLLSSLSASPSPTFMQVPTTSSTANNTKNNVKSLR